MSLKILHTADWHGDYDRSKMTKLTDSLEFILQYVQSNKINAVIHAGDIWERKQSFSGMENSAVPIIQFYLRQISKHVDFIFITKGNNSHDEPGSVMLLDQLEHNIYAYEYPVVLGVSNFDRMPFDLLRTDMKNPQLIDYIVSLIPYPSKSMFVLNDSIDNNNSQFLEKFEEMFEGIGDINDQYKCPKILAFHGNVVGTKLSSGQTLVSQDIMLAPATLQKAHADYYALGHIHLRQEILPNMIYSGSIYNKNWGETEKKSFEIVEFKGWNADQGELEGKMTTERIMIPSAKAMETVAVEFDGEFKYNCVPNDNTQYRLKIKVNENDRGLLTEAKLADLEETFGYDIKIETNIIPAERESRSEKIMECKSLVDEVAEYAVIIGEPLHNGITTKAAKIQGD